VGRVADGGQQVAASDTQCPQMGYTRSADDRSKLVGRLRERSRSPNPFNLHTRRSLPATLVDMGSRESSPRKRSVTPSQLAVLDTMAKAYGEEAPTCDPVEPPPEFNLGMGMPPGLLPWLKGGKGKGKSQDVNTKREGGESSPASPMSAESPKPKPVSPSAGSPKKGKGGPPMKGAAPFPKKGKGKAAVAEPWKPEVTPSIPLKKLFWSPISLAGSVAPGDAAELTVWQRIHQAGARFDAGELEAKFAETPQPASLESVAGRLQGCGAGQAPAAKRRRLFDERRRRQIWFMLALMPDRSELPQAVANMDGSVLEPDRVDLLLSNLPSPAEEAIVKAAVNDTVLEENEVWDIPEEFMMMLTSIPEYMVRVRLWGFLNSFQNIYGHLASSMADLASACLFLRESGRIEKLLALILYVGNYLNGGTSRGRADGFDVDTLTKLSKLKASQRELAGTLLDFIVGQMERDSPQTLQAMYMPEQEFEAVHRARRHRLCDLKEELAGHIRTAAGYLQKIDKHCQTETDEALTRSREGLAGNLELLRKLSVEFEDVEKLFADLRTWYRIDQDKLKSTDEFFGIWDEFLKDVKKALDLAAKQSRAGCTSRRRSRNCRPGSQSTPRSKSPRRPSTPRKISEPSKQSPVRCSPSRGYLSSVEPFLQASPSLEPVPGLPMGEVSGNSLTIAAPPDVVMHVSKGTEF